MKILMLGWEYPPHIAGGLGTACEGLTRALSERGAFIHFVVPHLFGDEGASHMVISDYGSAPARGKTLRLGSTDRSTPADPHLGTTTRFSAFLSPYWSAEQFRAAVSSMQETSCGFDIAAEDKPGANTEQLARELLEGEVYGIELISALAPKRPQPISPTGALYPHGDTIFEEVERFTTRVISQMAKADFDLIHAHDWMTFPAGVALAQLTGRPLVVHVHSLEQDRSGLFVDKNIEKIERLGLQSANRIVAVSHYTQNLIERYHDIAHDKIRVVHNGIYPRQAVQGYRIKRTWPKQIVLFLGRVTSQKGPDYFVEVANRVVPHIPDVLFVLAGTGDMVPSLVTKVEQLGLSENFLFPGFLSAEEVEEIFSIADLYVMPSVSEPFGISALEAISFDVPAIISKQSGVAEVMQSALKVDFWDLPRMAELIIDVLTRDELRQELISSAKRELKDLHWGAAAEKTLAIYGELLGRGSAGGSGKTSLSRCFVSNGALAPDN